jgi:ribulose-5-phosphate 4-epimerase/fuculose-1-phosphate aldolase
MQVFVDELCQRSADAAHLHEIIHARAQYALESSELLQELAPACRPETGNRFKGGFIVTPRASPAMSGDSESMRLVADALDQMERC